MSFKYNSGIIKPGFNPLASQTSNYFYENYIYSWGRNLNGRLGLGNITGYSSPKQIGALSTWKQVTNVGNYATAAIKTDGTLWSWGDGLNGKLGLGNTTSYSSPKQVGALTTWSFVAGGAQCVYAIKTDGTFWVWGANYLGSLGLGNSTYYSSPKQLGALTNWLKVASGQYCAFAVKTDGTLWSWGYNLNASLGIGNTTTYSSPKQIGALTTWRDVGTGQYFGFAIKTDGTLWAWGSNGSGNLGLGNTTSYSSPKQVGGLTTWLSVVGTYTQSVLGLTNDGKLYSWGKNDVGQLGLGDTGYRSNPTQIGALSTWSKIPTVSKMYSHMAAIKNDDSLWTWGDNSYGQLGLSNQTYYSSPKLVGDSTNWSDVTVGVLGTTALAY